MVRNAFLHLTNIVQGTVVWLRFKAQVKHRPPPPGVLIDVSLSLIHWEAETYK